MSEESEADDLRPIAASRPAWSNIRDAFDTALDLGKEDREAFLCEGLPTDVAAEVRSLLQHHRVATAFLTPAPTPLLREALCPLEPSRTQPDDLRGRMLCGRYELGALIGRGGTASVYEATDGVSGALVAVKVRPSKHVLGCDLIREEATALRLLRLPGIVELIDEGREEAPSGEQPLSFLVMERIFGAPFPGDTNGSAWTAIRAATLSLLEALARLHWTGVAHCDLKPSNVLVRADGTSVILDLGIAQDSRSDPTIRQALALAGTPRYRAPEQLLGEAGTERSDLYAVGIMLYEALAGRDPHDARDAAEIISFRPNVPPPPLRAVAPEVPEAVAAVVDALIGARPQDRPSSAADVLARLQTDASHGTELPHHLGSRVAIDAVVAAARAGVALDIHGAPGSGRTSTLGAAAARLRSSGHRTIWIKPGPEPFGGLRGLVSLSESAAARTPEELATQVRAEVRRLLTDGTVLLVDDANRLDRLSADLLDGCREAGAVIRSFDAPIGDSLELGALKGADLIDLFAGPERIHHLSSDAAAELRARTAGRPGAVKLELAAWERAGLARWEDGRLTLCRADLERLRGGLRVRADTPQTSATWTGEAAGLLACIDLLGNHATVVRCATVLERAVWHVEAGARELAEAGALAIDREGLLRPLRATLGDGHWPPEQRARIHERIADALPTRAPVRPYYLLRAGRVKKATLASMEISEALLRDGMASRACALLCDSLAATRQGGLDVDEAEALELLLDASLQMGTFAALDQLLYVLGRSTAATRRIRVVERIARAAHLGLQRDTIRAFGHLPRLSSDLTARAFRCVLSARLFLARQLKPEQGAQVLAESTTAVAARGDDSHTSLLTTAQAWLAYAADDFVQAARLHAGVAETASAPLPRLGALLNCASAWLETSTPERVLPIAEEARQLAAAGRHVHYEARAERILRAAAYRRGTALEVDDGLIEAISALGVPHLEALTCLNEAAVAWRGGDDVGARALGKRACQIWRHAGNALPALLARSIEVGSGAPISEEELREAASLLASDERPAVRVQCAALLGQARTAGSALFRDRAVELASLLPDTRWSQRLEIMSIEEAVQ